MGYRENGKIGLWEEEGEKNKGLGFEEIKEEFFAEIKISWCRLPTWNFEEIEENGRVKQRGLFRVNVRD